MAAIGGFPGEDGSHELRVYQGAYAEPVKHYGRSLYRAEYTACGKSKTDVVVTYSPDKVTCETCIEELKLQTDQETK